MGRKSHNLTDEEKAERKREYCRKYYQRNKEIMDIKSTDCYHNNNEAVKSTCVSDIKGQN